MDYKSILPSTDTPLSGVAGAVLILIVIWTLIWKGLALWKAARKGSTVWFVVLMIVNTIGILDLLYYFFSGKGEEGKKS